MTIRDTPMSAAMAAHRVAALANVSPQTPPSRQEKELHVVE